MSLSSRRSGSRRQFSKNARRETLTMTEFSDDDRLYLDDLHIGQRFTSGTQVVDEEQIKAFARQFDPQPFHLDNEAAEGILFSGLVASGWHTAAITMHLLVDGCLPFAGGIIGVGGDPPETPRPARQVFPAERGHHSGCVRTRISLPLANGLWRA